MSSSPRTKQLAYFKKSHYGPKQLNLGLLPVLDWLASENSHENNGPTALFALMGKTRFLVIFLAFFAAIDYLLY